MNMYSYRQKGSIVISRAALQRSAEKHFTRQAAERASRQFTDPDCSMDIPVRALPAKGGNPPNNNGAVMYV